MLRGTIGDWYSVTQQRRPFLRSPHARKTCLMTLPMPRRRQAVASGYFFLKKKKFFFGMLISTASGSLGTQPQEG